MKMKLVYSGVVQPGHCDVMGHLTTREYLGFFDEASYLLINEATGWNPASAEWGQFGWVDVLHSLEYRAEVLAGTIIQIAGAFSHYGKSSISTSFEMTAKHSGKTVASLQGKSVFFDLNERRSTNLTQTMRNGIENHLTQ